jgi:hypothetical protein
MPAPTPGWYADASHGGQVRWWNGTAWSDYPTPSAPGPAAPSVPTVPAPTVPAAAQKAPMPKPARIAIAVVLGFIVLLIAAGSGILGPLLVVLGLLAAAVGAYAAVVGSAPRFRVNSRKIGALFLGAGLFAAMIGGAANAATYSPPTASLSAGVTSDSEESEPAKTAKPTPTATPTPTPVVEQKEVREPIVIPFDSTTTDDATLAVGTTAIAVAGAHGEKVIVHLVTYTDGVETGRSVLREEITVQPITQVTAVGTKQPYVAPPPPPAPVPAPKTGGCHASYTGACVPIASDVDCAGGSGNGPEYVSGPLRVVGPDIYDLERDGDGIACD